jgi:malate synthase
VDTLRNLFGNFTATVLRLALIVGTLAAVYFFIVKPTLDTTEEISSRSFNQSQQIQRNIQRDIQKRIRETNRQVQQSIKQSFQQTKQQGGANPQQLLACVQRARQDVEKIQACSRKF